MHSPLRLLALTSSLIFLGTLVTPLEAKQLETVVTREERIQAPTELRKLDELPVLVGFGADPSQDKYPLKECQGDCDDDSDCDSGLVCFKRTPGQEVPGCQGGQHSMSETDYCVKVEVKNDSGATSSLESSGTTSSGSPNASTHFIVTGAFVSMLLGIYLY